MASMFDIQISWLQLLKRTVSETIADDGLGLAAQMAYYFFLALFPAVLFILGVASFFPLANVVGDISRVLGPFVSPGVMTLIQDQMQRLGNADSGGILTFGLVAALWSSSSAVTSIVSSLNKAYDIDERRPWWKVRLISIGLTVALAVFFLTSLWLILAGPELATYLGRTVGLGPVFEWSWKIAQWPVAFALAATALGLVYYIAPDADQNWVWVSPGAVAGTILWMLGSLGFRFYVVRFGDYNESYGAVGSVIVLMLWFYVSGLALLIGAEMNSEIEHASPRGKNPGDRFAPGPATVG